MNRIQRTLLKIAGLSYLVDAANPREIYQRPFEIQTYDTVHEEISLTDLLRIVSDSRKLYCNLGPLKGAVDDKAVYSVGRAWAAKSTATDRAWAEKAQKWVNEIWYPMADARGSPFDFKTDLFLLSVGADRDGDIFILLTESADGWPMIQLLPTQMIGQRNDESKILDSGPYAGLRMIQGVVVNEVGRAVAFQVLGRSEADDQLYSARDIIQVFDPQWPDQVRGFPAFMHAILDLKDLRQMQGYQRIYAMLMASIGLVENNELGAPNADDPTQLLRGNASPFVGPADPRITVQETMGVTTRFFRSGSGSKLEEMKSERPGDAVIQHMNRLIRNACTGAGWPYELTWDPSALGGANVRLLIARAMRSVEDRQDLLRPIARRIVGYAVAKAIKKGFLEDNDEWYAWDFAMPARMTADYGRDAKADLADYQAGLTTLTDILDEEGKDLDAFIARKKTEQEKLAAAGITMPGPAPKPNEQPPQDN